VSIQPLAAIPNKPFFFFVIVVHVSTGLAMDQCNKIKLHTIERLNSRQLSNPVFVLANNITEIADVKSIMLILQC